MLITENLIHLVSEEFLKIFCKDFFLNPAICFYLENEWVFFEIDSVVGFSFILVPRWNTKM